MSGSGPVGAAPTVRPPAAPWVSITCPADGLNLGEVRFGHRYRAEAGVARIVIDYGDGRSYTTDRPAFVEAAFRHNYEDFGDYKVSVRLIDTLGREAVDACSFSSNPID